MSRLSQCWAPTSPPQTTTDATRLLAGGARDPPAPLPAPKTPPRQAQCGFPRRECLARTRKGAPLLGERASLPPTPCAQQTKRRWRPLRSRGSPLPLSLLPLPSRAPTRMAAPYSNAPDRSLDPQGPSQGCADVDLEPRTLERVRRARPEPAVAGTDRTRITGLSGHSEGHPSARGRRTAPEGLRRDEVPRSAPWPRPRRPEPRGNLQASGRSEGSPRPPSSSRGGGPPPTPPDSAVEISGKICIELRT